MPPRFAYWTILAGGLPTAFRAADRDDLLPTFRRIQDKHPDAEMKWFARGKLWDSPEAAQAARARTTPRRDRSWRPGGDHLDRRESFKAAARERNRSRRQQRFVRKQRALAQDEPRDEKTQTHTDRRGAGASRERPRAPRQGTARRDRGKKRP